MIRAKIPSQSRRLFLQDWSAAPDGQSQRERPSLRSRAAKAVPNEKGAFHGMLRARLPLPPALMGQSLQRFIGVQLMLPLPGICLGGVCCLGCLPI